MPGKRPKKSPATKVHAHKSKGYQNRQKPKVGTFVTPSKGQDIWDTFFRSRKLPDLKALREAKIGFSILARALLLTGVQPSLLLHSGKRYRRIDRVEPYEERAKSYRERITQEFRRLFSDFRMYRKLGSLRLNDRLFDHLLKSINRIFDERTVEFAKSATEKGELPSIIRIKSRGELSRGAVVPIYNSAEFGVSASPQHYARA